MARPITQIHYTSEGDRMAIDGLDIAKEGLRLDVWKCVSNGGLTTETVVTINGSLPLYDAEMWVDGTLFALVRGLLTRQEQDGDPQVQLSALMPEMTGEAAGPETRTDV